MSQVIDAQGQDKLLPAVVKGMIIAFYGTRIPEGWQLCDGTNGTPDLRGRTLIGDTAVGTGTAGGTEPADTGLTHSGFALANHTAHGVTQNSAHSAHAVTQASAHSNHAMGQPTTHPAHFNDGSTAGDHTHSAHSTVATGSLAVATDKLTGPGTHAGYGGHVHDAHPAHTGWSVTAHSAHTGVTVDAHSAHSGAAVDAHSAHGMTQAGNHLMKVLSLAWVMKL